MDFISAHESQERLDPYPQYPASPSVPDTKEWRESSTWTFRLILVSLCMIAVIVSIDGTSIAIALPTISNSFDAADNYVWIANCFVLSQTVIQPPYAQICNIFGRRVPMIVAVGVFAIGSAIGGSARSVSTLIAGRTIQGLGSGGINMLVDLIICDLVPLRERSKYIGIIHSISAIGTITGPIIGGAFANSNWRWIFWINIPVAGITMVIMALYLRLRCVREPTWSAALARVDWLGNFLFISSTCAILFAIISGGAVMPWSSWRVLVPLILGTLGCVLFYFHQQRCKEPSVPTHLFSNRTSVAAFGIQFISSLVLMWVSYFWPIYFQGLRGISALKVGINMLPFVTCLIPSAAIGGILLAKFGHYRPFHYIGFSISIIGTALNTLLTKNTATALWALFQIIDACGRGILIPAVLPAILASLSENDSATATGFYSFLRSFGFVWGITIPGIIFNARFNHYSPQINDERTRQHFAGADAYSSFSGAQILGLPTQTRDEVFEVLRKSLKDVWIAATIFSVLGLSLVLFEKHVPLRVELETAFGAETEESSITTNDPQQAEKADIV